MISRLLNISLPPPPFFFVAVLFPLLELKKKSRYTVTPLHLTFVNILFI